MRLLKIRRKTLTEREGWGHGVLDTASPLELGSAMSPVAALIALLRPVRRLVQQVVDQRCFRRRYDAVRTLTQLTARLRDQLNPDALAGDTCRVISGKVQPAHDVLWAVPGRTR